MNIVITSTGNSKDSKFDLRFGRAAYFCLVNIETNETSFIKNVNIDAVGGAGTKAAENMVELGVEKVISGDFGPKAKDLLDKFKIQMVMLDDEKLTIQEITEKLKA